MSQPNLLLLNVDCRTANFEQNTIDLQPTANKGLLIDFFLLYALLWGPSCFVGVIALVCDKLKLRKSVVT